MWRRSIVTAIALVATLAVPGCGGNGGGPCGDSFGIENTLASAERWVQVRSAPTVDGADGTVEVSFEVVGVRANPGEGSPRRETIAIHTPFLPGIDEALASHDQVFLALAKRGLEHEMVAAVIRRGTDGSHHLVGECMSSGEEVLRQRLDGEYDSRIDAVIGSTSRARILDLLSNPS